jgi:choline-sulfatase
MFLPAGNAGGETPPNVLLITLDTTRADHLSCYGYSKPTSPNVDRLAREGARFVAAYTSVPITLPSHITMMTGLYPFRTGVRDNGQTRLSPSTRTLASVLRQNHYATLAYVSAAVLDRTFGLDNGFDLYDDNVRIGRPETFGYEERTASQVNEAVFEGAARIREPYFMWVHYYDPHMPYVPPPPFDIRFKESPYDGEIAYADLAIGKLLDFLAERKVLEHTIIVVAGDHGEGLGDRGEKLHGSFLYPHAQHVPLLIRFPGAIRPGTTVQGLAGLVDIMPTVLDYAGIATPRGLDGVSLRKAITSGKSSRAEIYEETLLPENNYGWSPLFGLRVSGWHWILAPTPELYNTASDPAEIRNLAAQSPDIVARLSARLGSYLSIRIPSMPADVSPELREQLNSLGYLAPPRADQLERRLDPKEGMPLLQRIEHAKELARANKLDEAITELSDLLRKNPENVDARTQLGNYYAAAGRQRQARDEFLAALRYREFDRLYFNLGNSELALGRLDEAAQDYRKAVAMNPRLAGAYTNWATLEMNRGRAGRAGEILDEALSRHIQDPVVFLLRGRLFAASGNLMDAESQFHRALAQNGDSADAHRALGQLYFQTERIDDSLAEYEESLRLQPTDIATLKTVGAIYLNKKEDSARARQCFEKALALDPNAPDAPELRDLLSEMP